MIAKIALCAIGAGIGYLIGETIDRDHILAETTSPEPEKKPEPPKKKGESTKIEQELTKDAQKEIDSATDE